MSGEWKPGEIVVGLLDGNEIVGIVRGGGKRMFYADSVTTDQVDLKHVRNLRPLVVIDPEDKSQDNDVSRLCWLIGKHHGEGGTVDLGLDWLSLQAALREFADPTPPKPAEPTGLGAVVEDADGNRWVRLDRQVTPWVDGQSFPQRWRDLVVVRIVSEGVTA